MTCCVATRSRDLEKGDLVLGLFGLEKKYESRLFTRVTIADDVTGQMDKSEETK